MIPIEVFSSDLQLLRERIDLRLLQATNFEWRVEFVERFSDRPMIPLT